MHTDLSQHLHSEKCNELIRLLQECHNEHPFRKFVGYCNSLDHQMTKCLKEERLARRQRNFEKSKEMKEKLRRLLREDKNLD
ncbi:COX assembly mitochondrial protein 2 homolog [Tribolium madens]|uniref:COX assembly mitochondrial protein 2 homolog n=1 Tax=Tribolium madens TaxID=41895 RepID=UPI001CF727E6|nr:COX assembly mitochondrial protein 2 homolog [Tribolium madens]